MSSPRGPDPSDAGEGKPSGAPFTPFTPVVPVVPVVPHRLGHLEKPVSLVRAEGRRRPSP